MREIAYRVPIALLLNGEYEKSTEQYSPNYVKIGDMRISRAYIMGVVIDRYDNETNQYTGLTIDDGTGKILAKLFGEDVKFARGIQIGDLVRVIGKIRENERGRYLICEIVKKIEDKGWQELWKLEVIDKYSRQIESMKNTNEQEEVKETDNEGGKKEKDEIDNLDINIEEIDV